MRISDWSSDVCSSDLSGESCICPRILGPMAHCGRPPRCVISRPSMFAWERALTEIRITLGGLAAAALLTLAPLSAQAREIIVHMKNQGAEGAMVFEPSFMKAAVGDTIRFPPTHPSHNAETMATIDRKSK